MLSVIGSGYTVSPVVPEELPWMVRLRLRLRSARKKGRTGLILYGIIRQGPRQISRQLPWAGLMEGKRKLGTRSPHARLPKWESLSPGTHEIRFLAGNTIRSSTFDARITLAEGDVLVAVCEPVQPNTFYAKSPEADTWRVGIIDSAGRVRAAPSAKR